MRLEDFLSILCSSDQLLPLELGIAGLAGDGRQATAALLNFPASVAFYSNAAYVPDAFNCRIRKIDLSTMIISTFAGTSCGFLGDGGLAVNARLHNPSTIAFDAQGNAFISDRFNNRVRRVNSSGYISTYAGNGTATTSGNGELATLGSMYWPQYLAFDASENLFVGAYSNNKILKITKATGAMTTISGNGTGLTSGDGGPASSATVNGPVGLAFDPQGNLYVGEYMPGRIRKIIMAAPPFSSPPPSPPPPPPPPPLGLFPPPLPPLAPGTIVTVAGDGLYAFSGDGGPASSASLFRPNMISYDPSGGLLIPDSSNNRIRRVDLASGVITTIAGNGLPLYAGDGGLAMSASLSFPYHAVYGHDGCLYISDSGNHVIRKVDAQGIITTFAGTGKGGGNSSSLMILIKFSI